MTGGFFEKLFLSFQNPVVRVRLTVDGWMYARYLSLDTHSALGLRNKFKVQYVRPAI